MRLFTLNGYVTFMPDSFARPGRYMACGKRTDTLLRYEEIENALAEMRKIPWIDQKRLILAGFSSGGLAAAEYGGDEFKVRVILGWGCSKGISAASSVPVLNLVGKNDSETWAGNALCSVAGRENSLAQHVDAGHDVSEDAKAMAIVKDFLERTL
jgi:dienelactone hydrolase